VEQLLEQVERVVGALGKKDKKPQNYQNGERLYDNQNVCLLLNISKRTLQRYRDNGLKYHTILHKTYYREKDLHEFIRWYFDEENVGKAKKCMVKIICHRKKTAKKRKPIAEMYTVVGLQSSQ